MEPTPGPASRRRSRTGACCPGGAVHLPRAVWEQQVQWSRPSLPSPQGHRPSHCAVRCPHRPGNGISAKVKGLVKVTQLGSCSAGLASNSHRESRSVTAFPETSRPVHTQLSQLPGGQQAPECGANRHTARWHWLMETIKYKQMTPQMDKSAPSPACVWRGRPTRLARVLALPPAPPRRA